MEDCNSCMFCLMLSLLALIFCANFMVLLKTRSTGKDLQPPFPQWYTDIGFSHKKPCWKLMLSKSPPVTLAEIAQWVPIHRGWAERYIL